MPPSFNLIDLEAALDEFGSLVPTLVRPTRATCNLALLRDKRSARAQSWASLAGIYAFTQGEELRYIGRALSSVSLSSRACDHVADRCRGDPKWDAVLDDPTSRCHIYALDPKDTVWVASLELYLIDRFAPALVNRRRS
jgi:hypothetical protein